MLKSSRKCVSPDNPDLRIVFCPKKVVIISALLMLIYLVFINHIIGIFGVGFTLVLPILSIE